MGSETIHYSPAQAEVLRLHDLYRTCLLNQKYYSHKLNSYKLWNRVMDIVVALATSSAFAGLAIWKSGLGANFFSILLAASVVVSVLRPILKLTEGIDRYSKLHYGYSQLSFQVENVLTDMRRRGGPQDDHLKTTADIEDRYRNLGLEDDAGPNLKLLKKFQAEVNEAVPAERLWLPSSGK